MSKGSQFYVMTRPVEPILSTTAAPTDPFESAADAEAWCIEQISHGARFVFVIVEVVKLVYAGRPVIVREKPDGSKEEIPIPPTQPIKENSDVA